MLEDKDKEDHAYPPEGSYQSQAFSSEDKNHQDS